MIQGTDHLSPLTLPTPPQDEKEILRTTLYFENHNSLKQLINEEKTFPFREQDVEGYQTIIRLT